MNGDPELRFSKSWKEVARATLAQLVQSKKEARRAGFFVVRN